MKVEPLELPLTTIRSTLDSMRRPFSVAIQRSRNGFNIGAIIRVAHSFLVREIILIGDEDWYAKAAMSCDRWEHIVEVPDEAAFLTLVKQREVPLVAVERDTPKATNLWRTTLPTECILLLGSENLGVTPELLEAAASAVYIPMNGLNHSLPVVAAASIVMAEWDRQHWGNHADT